MHATQRAGRKPPSAAAARTSSGVCVRALPQTRQRGGIMRAPARESHTTQGPRTENGNLDKLRVMMFAHRPSDPSVDDAARPEADRAVANRAGANVAEHLVP
jgi:hypothetical protein